MWKPVFEQIVELFCSIHIAMLPLKAFDYGEQLYPISGLRRFSDIDVLVKTEQYLPAIRLLVGNGYRLLDEHIEVLQTNPHKVSEVSLRSPQGYLIEIHQLILPVKNFFRYEIGFQLDHQQIWDRSARYGENDAIHASMSLVDTMAHLCLHAAAHGLSAQSPFTYLDIDCWLRQSAERMDWDEFFQTVRGWKIRNAAYHAFQLCQKNYNTPIPAEVMHQLEPGWWAKWRVGLVYSFEAYINHDLSKPGIRNPKLVRLMLHDSFIDILKILFGGFFPSRMLRKAVYDEPVSLPKHWMLIAKKFGRQSHSEV